MSIKYYHLCNPTTPEISGCKNIGSKQALQEIKDDSNAVYLMNIHLNWEGNKLSSNYGFDIANLIRTEKKSKAPIIFYSPIQVEYFEHKSEKEIKYKILFGRGSAFIEAPFKETTLSKLAESIVPLSKAALHDVVTMLCNLKGIVIDKLNHDLKFEADIDKVISSVSPYLSALQKGAIELESFVAKLKESKSENKPILFNDIKQSFILLCNSKLTEQGNKEPKGERTKHKILLIDDLPSEIKKAKDNLKSEFTIETATTGKEAISILSKDTKNEIVAVVSDWRLFTDEKQNYWQSLQGYEVLDFAAKNGIRSLFALTSQADFVVHHLRNLLGIRFSMFKKENLNTADQWKVFTDILFEACNEAVKLRASLPKSVQWTNEIGNKSYKQLYIEMWNADNRDEYLFSVEEKCNEVWNYIMKEREHDYKKIQLIKDKFNIEIPKKELDLFPVLVLRRIWMALWYLRVDNLDRMSRESVTDTINWIYQVVCTGMSTNYEGNHANVEQNKLSLMTKEIQDKKMLPEERDWLTKNNLLESE